MNKREIGTKYEELASQYLESIDYVIVCRNFRCRTGEIDIIAKEKEYLCFIEVKYRSKNAPITGFEAVDKKKQITIRKVAEYYLYSKKIKNDTPCRFDVLSIDEEDNNEIKYSLIRNAFM